jgi:TonB family protein
MIALVVKATVVLAAAFAATALLRRRSAALRHFLWSAALAALLLLPALSWRMPRVTVVQPAMVVQATAGVVAAPAARPVPWLPLLYAAGLAAAAGRFLLGAIHTALLVRRGKAAPELGPDVVMARAPMPLAWGIFRRRVVLPEAARGWPPGRLRSVLLHERMHHRRHDLVAQAVAQTACCVFWFHPLVWMALARQRAERERACDDAVLRQGVPAPEYAGHLMEVVRAAAGDSWSWSNAPAMAEGSNLEARVRAMLDGTKDRRPLTRWGVAMMAAAVVAVLAPLAALELRAQSPGGGVLAGTVKDPSGARVPGCMVTVKDAGGATQASVTTDQVGMYRVPGLAGGQYTLEFSARGFALGKVNTTLVGGAAETADFNLSLGHITETVAVTGRKSAPVMPKAAPQRIKVGGNVQAARLIRQPRPVYPPELQAAGVEGNVLMQAVIGKDGSVMAAKVTKSSGNAALDEAALTAVRQWQYTPTLLNGEPVETLTTVSLEFQLEQ